MILRDPYVIRYWIEFEIPPVQSARGRIVIIKSFFGCGVGVSAYSFEDALDLLARLGLFNPWEIPPVGSTIENVNVSSLPQLQGFGRGIPCIRGVWFPFLGFLYDPRAR